MPRRLAKPDLTRGLLTALLGVGLLSCATPTRAPDTTTASVSAAGAPAPRGAAPAAERAPAPRALKMTLGTISATNAPVVVARSAGFAARRGLEVELVAARSASEAMAAVVSRDAPIGAMGGAAVINAGAAGADVVSVALQQSRLTQQLLVRPEIRTVADLRGKRIGVADVGGSTDLAAQYLLDKAGLRRAEDVAIAALGSANERVGGLEAGAVQGAMLTEPFAAAARKAGYQVLFDFGEEDYELPSSSVTTTRSYLESDPESVRAFVAAVVDSIHYIKTDREGTMAIMGEFLQQDDREVLEAIYREASGSAMPEAPYPSVRAFANGLEQIATQNPTVRQVRPEDLVEDRFVRELDQSGYIRALYGR
jgi:NitT/TauT family transport system substrate-binding protein